MLHKRQLNKKNYLAVGQVAVSVEPGADYCMINLVAPQYRLSEVETSVLEADLGPKYYIDAPHWSSKVQEVSEDIDGNCLDHWRVGVARAAAGLSSNWGVGAGVGAMTARRMPSEIW